MAREDTAKTREGAVKSHRARRTHSAHRARRPHRRTTVIAVIGAASLAVAAGATLVARSAATDGADRKPGSSVTSGSSGSAQALGSSGSLGPLSGPSGHGAVSYAGSLNGANEVPVPGGPAVGDKDGRAIAFMRIEGDRVSFAFTFRGIGAPTAAHLHRGGRGANGAVALPLFVRKSPYGRTTVSGTVEVEDRRLLDELRSGPEGFYFNLHTGEFPGGAVRGQVHRLASSLDIGRAPSRTFQASVAKGAQIYACAKGPDGRFTFTQNNVRARLGGDISHFFDKPGPQGPPAWAAPDGSAVTGRLLTRTPNGPGNIPELDLKATQAGLSSGLLAGVGEILRLNTVGGTAPAGTCDPAARAKVAVPYAADYLFIKAG